MSRRLARLGRFAGRLAFVGVHLWLTGAAWYAGLGPTPLPQLLAGAVFLGFPIAWVRASDRRRVAWVFVGFAVLAIGAWQLKRPATDREWVADMRRMPDVRIEGDSVTIDGIRDCRYRTTDAFDLRYQQRRFDLGALRSVDFLVERFHAWQGLAHTLLTFGFEGGEHLAISVELRREVGEAFHPIAGCFRQFELMYVIGTEQDLIGLRTNLRRSAVWLFPVRTTPERKRALLLDMLHRARELATTPEFYNTLCNSCTTNIVDHVRGLVPGRVPIDWRIWLPGYAGELAHELGLIDTDLPFSEAERVFRIDLRAQEGPIGADFSQRIRAARQRVPAPGGSG